MLHSDKINNTFSLAENKMIENSKISKFLFLGHSLLKIRVGGSLI